MAIITDEPLDKPRLDAGRISGTPLARILTNSRCQETLLARLQSRRLTAGTALATYFDVLPDA